MTFVSLQNGGGVGIGRSIHCGFSLLLDGSGRVDEIIRNGIQWDVMGGVARRSWARNENAIQVAAEHNLNTSDCITLPWLTDDSLVKKTVRSLMPGKEGFSE
jgi:urocanate hydratase